MYRQTIEMPVIWGLALKWSVSNNHSQTWISKDQIIIVMSSGNIHALVSVGDGNAMLCLISNVVLSNRPQHNNNEN